MKDYCPACRETTSLHEKGICPWCDTPLVGKRSGALNDSMLHVIRELKDRGYTVKAIAEANYQAWGYSSANTCQNAISLGWKRMGLSSRKGQRAA